MSPLKHTVIIVGTLIGLAACAPPAPPAVDTSADEAAIKAGTDTWFEAYNAGDVETIVGLYAEDGVVMPPQVLAAYGHGAIRTFLAADIIASKAAGLTQVGGPSTVAVSGDLAYHSGSFTVTDASGTAVDSGSYLEALRKTDGKWLIVRDIWNSDRPLPAPAAASATSAK
jgi:uncharacterized protein (TIGR02246 family)